MAISARRTVVKLGIAAAAFVFLLGVSYWWWLYRPSSQNIERLEASRCRLYYKYARTAADSAKVEDGYWVVDYSRRRTPTCGELLREGKI